ncbi:MAG TPA: tyrosine-type recombinase/integrase [Acetobacteraceae bacterium]|nr:tyrosine-type recombinase/integrase [Acetobacteraceae bacterium]
MPLRVVRRADTGKLWIAGTIKPAGAKEGVRIRQRAGTDSPELAREEAAALEAKILRDFHLGEKRPECTFSRAVASYLEAEDRAVGTVALVDRLHDHFKDGSLRKIDQAAVDEARKAILRPNAKPATVKRNLIVPLRAILLHAHRRGWCDAPSFEIPAEQRGRTKFLLPEQAEALIAAAGAAKRSGHLVPLLRFFLCTGCRVGETLALDWSQVDLLGARARIWADQAKSGAERIVNLPPAAVAALAALRHREGRVFLTARREPYRSSEEYGGQLKTAWASACSRAGLSGFGPHALRHTWASWHYCVHRDLLRLKLDGGWSSVALVERYAHLLPAGHEEGIRRLWGIREGKTLAAVESQAS